jgi:DNA sulfur modification protein DndD
LQGRIEATIDKATADKRRLATLADELSRVSEEIDKVGLQIARAPDEVTLKTELESLTAMRERISTISAKREGYRETARSSLREAKEIARVLDQEQEAINAAAAVTKDILLAKMVQRVLGAFGKRAATEKTTLLAREFSESFARLARKDDMSVSADINPDTFNVTLRNREGRLIDKDELSAGEKQIYAIAMLEALAKTSGRKLPIIIDTPLGRLDSKHREKLVNKYFPTASHQVVILSTDTEVDEQFYRDLNKHISHSYKLEYDPATGHTTASESYFWKNTAKVEAA